MTDFDQKYSFDDFVIGNSNEYAFKAAQSIAKSPGASYNPLFIYGKTGTGKTHLLNAIGLYINENSPNIKVKYETAERFVEKMIVSCKNNNMTTFWEYYTALDVLLIDDVQYVSGKEKTQDELVLILDEFYANRKQIVLASCMDYNILPNIKERIRSRFGRGLVIDIGSPDYEMKMSIVKRMGTQNDVLIDPNVLAHIDKVNEQNGFDLEGIVKRAKFYSEIFHKSKCIVCGTEIEVKEGKISLCSQCRKREEDEDTPAECKECQKLFSFPDCLDGCSRIPDDDKYSFINSRIMMDIPF